jgi:Holliday junction resolvasome RuvABC endonuclease subunit
MCYGGVDPGLVSPAAAVVSADGRLLAASSLTIGRDLRGGRRLAEIRRQVAAFFAPWGALAGSAIEGPSLGSTHREYDLGEASGVFRGWLFEATDEEPWVVEPARLKLYATGNGAADKAAVLQYVVRELKYPVDGDDAADAAVLAHIAFALGSKVRPSTRDQAEVLHGLRKAAPTKRRAARRSKTLNI